MKITSNKHGFTLLSVPRGLKIISLPNGFTIVELLVVIVVIGILAAITIVSYSGITSKANASVLQSDLTNASNQLKLYQIDHSAYPTSLNASNCPLDALNVVDDRYCLKSSSGNTLLYSSNNNSTPQIFCANATRGTTSYIITNDGAPSVGICPGLLASYYTNMTLAGSPAVRQMELNVYHFWEIGSPGSGLPADGFSVRYSGYVTATVAGTYTFMVTSDDGERLYVNNTLIVDKWADQGTTTWSGTIDLTAGQKVPIAYEMYEKGGGATAVLEWVVPGGSQVTIPSSALSQT